MSTAWHASRWESQKERLRVLWYEEKKTLDQIMNFMAAQHDFHEEKWRYEAAFRDWGFRRNLKAADWVVISGIISKRKPEEDKESDVFDNDILVSSKKVKKEIGRKRKSNSDAPDEALPPGVEIRTPKSFLGQVAVSKVPSVDHYCVY